MDLMLSDQTLSYLKLHLYKGVGSKTLADLHTLYSDPEDMFQSLKPQDELQDRLNFELKLIEKHGVTVLSQVDEAFPECLKHIEDPPVVVYVKGQLAALKGEEIVAVVGTRYPSVHARSNAKQLGEDCANAGWTVVSGLALGVDGAAHQGVLNKGGVTIAVLGTGLAQTYPSDHKEMAKDICEKGCLLSEFRMELGPSRGTFPKRNRMISALSNKGVVVVEGAKKSGSLITATYAKRQGRMIYAMPGVANHVKTAGNNHLLKQGAYFLESAYDLKGFPKKVEKKRAVQKNIILSEQQKTVLSWLVNGPSYLQNLHCEAKKKGLTLPQMTSILTLLELKGLVRQLPGQKYCKI